jgi:hypothetical protein
VKSINPVSLVPFLGSLVDALTTGESVTDMSTEPMTAIYDAAQNIANLAKGNDVTGYKVVYDLLRAVSQVTGIPISNATRDVVALWNTGVDAVGLHNLKLQTYRDYDSAGHAALYAALESGNTKRQARIREEMEDNGATGAEGGLRGVIKDRWEAGDLTDEEAEAQLVEYAGLSANEAHWKMAEWIAKAGGAESWARADGVIDAILNGGDWQAEWDDLITYATGKDYDDSDARTAVRSRIKSLFEAGRISEDTARALLSTCIYGTDRESREAVQAWIEAMREE